MSVGGVVVVIVGLLVIHQSNAEKSRCDVFQGSWVLVSESSSYPLYNSTSCPFIQKEFNCQKNGRPDHFYLNYTWQPHACNLSRFDGGELLRRYKGKSIMFVGDSLSRNQWQSLICMLYSSVPGANYYMETASAEVSTFTFTDFDVKVMLDHTVYLVDVVREAEGRILKLDSIQGCKRWKGIDVLIFNTWHWWNRRGATQPWDYIEVGGRLYKDMDRVVAFEKALTTWAKWVDTNVDPTNTKWEHVERTESEIVRGAEGAGGRVDVPRGIAPCSSSFEESVEQNEEACGVARHNKSFTAEERRAPFCVWAGRDGLQPLVPAGSP
ncbi:UNVERIFIED_CONTAM: Protein trichome birefringence-like 41 [Sesamum indicum]